MYYHWGCTSINPKMDVLANKQLEQPPRRLYKGGCMNSVHLRIQQYPKDLEKDDKIL